MKQLLIIILISLGLFACTKDENENKEEVQTSLTVEQQKEKLDKEGINFIGNLKDLENPDLMNPLAYFIEIIQDMDEDQFIIAKKIGADIILNSKKLKSEKFVKSATIDDASSLKRTMNDNQGIYTYNRSNKTWTKTVASGKIEFRFPSSETQTNNNSIMVISNLTTIVVYNQNVKDNLEDLPKTLTVDFKVDNATLYGLNFSADYNSDNIPTKEVYSLVLTPYKVVEEYSLSNNNLVSAKFSMSYKDQPLIAAGITAEGNFKDDQLSSEDAEVDDILHKSTAYLQIENVKVSGNIDIKNIASKMRDFEDQYKSKYNQYSDQYPKDYYDAVVGEFRKSTLLKVSFADRNEFFANLVPYRSSEKDIYYDAHWNPIEYTRNDYDFKLVLTDGSEVDESYFDSGFDMFKDKLNSFIDQINYDYDTEITNIE